MANRTLALISKCGKCSHPIQKTFSKRAYDHGVVLIRCDGCGVRHLIADHIGWFSHVQGHTLEDYYPGQVKYGTLEPSSIDETTGKITAKMTVDNYDADLIEGISKEELKELFVKASSKKH